MTIELKPCPFCGANRIVYYDDESPGGWASCAWYACDTCEAQGPKVTMPRVHVVVFDEAAAAWNTRAERSA